MRKILVSLAAAGAALAFASPAAAQYYPGQPYGYGYGYGQQYGYGFNNFGQVRALQFRIAAIEHQINRLDRFDRIGDREARHLRREADDIERRLHFAARFGLNPYEANDINVRIARLEQRVQFAMNNRYRYGYGYNGYYGDRDRDHDGDRDDRWGDRDDD